jgi:hypothetical protein
MADHLPPDNELIESYLLGRLNETEARDFLLRVEDDREFARKFRLIKTFPELMSEEGRRELERQQAQAVPGEKKKASRHFPKRKTVAWSAAIVLVLILSAILFLFIVPGTKNGTVVTGDTVRKAKELPVSPVPVKPVAPVPADTAKKAATTKASSEGTGPVAIPVKEAQDGIRLLSPADDAKFSRNDLIRFEWAMKADTFTRLYVVSRTTGKTALWRGIRPGTRSLEVPGTTFYPDRYDWYVGTKEHSRSFVVYE